MVLNPATDLRWLFFGMSGRLGRRAYFLLFIFWICVFAIPVGMAVRVADGGAAQTSVGFALIAVSSTAVWSIMAATVKRLHDLGIHGAAAFALLIPGLFVVGIPALCIWPSRAAPNRYGACSDARGH